MAAVALATLLAVTAVFYTSCLASAPAQVAPDEAHFAVHANAIAKTGADLNGTRLPLFVRITDPLKPTDPMRVWYQPMLFYAMAASFSIAPFSETSARAPIAMIGVINVLLMFAAARRLFGSNRDALVASAMLAMTPAHFLFSRQAVDYLCPLPFVLAWLHGVLAYRHSDRIAHLIGAMAALGVGVFTYVSSWAMMPLLAGLTIVIIRPRWPHSAVAAVTFVLPALLVLVLNPTATTAAGDVIDRYHLNTAGMSTGPLQAALNARLGERASLYWSFFNPSFLFFAGGSDALTATGRAGVFLLPIAPLMAAGVHALWRARTPEAVLLLCGLLIGPLPTVVALPETPGSTVGRVMTLLVFGVLIAAAGVRALWQQSTAAGVAAAMLVALMPLQWWTFGADYYSDYQVRSARRFDPNATRDVVAAVIGIERQSAIPAVFLHDEGDNKAIRWKFYTQTNQRDDLWSKTRYFQIDSWQPDDSPIGSLLLITAGDPRASRLLAAGCVKVRTVDGRWGAATEIFRRER